MSHPSVEDVRDDEALAALVPDWWDLWRRTPAATPFQSPAWLVPWWRSFRPGRLRTAAVRAGARLAALAPCYIEDGQRGRRLLPLGLAVTDHLDVLVDPAVDGAAEALSARIGSDDGWDRWELDELRPDAAGLALPCPADCEAAVEPASACPVLALSPGPDGWMRGIPARRRRQYRRAVRLAKELGAVAIVRVESEPIAFLQVLDRLHAARWRTRGGDGVLADPRVRCFQREAIPALLAAGLARLYTVSISGRMVGAYYGLLHARRAYAYLGGFDPEFAHASPGAILIGHAMAEAAREEAAEFDFLRGREDYKYAWGAADRWNRRRIFTRARR